MTSRAVKGTTSETVIYESGIKMWHLILSIVATCLAVSGAFNYIVDQKLAQHGEHPHAQCASKSDLLSFRELIDERRDALRESIDQLRDEMRSFRQSFEARQPVIGPNRRAGSTGK